MRRLRFLYIVVFLLTAYAVNGIAGSVSKTINTENTWTDSFSPTYQNTKGNMNISVIYSDSGSATTRLQRTFNNGSTWGQVKSYTESGENMLIDQEAGVRYRIGVATGEYGTGTIVVRLSN